MKEKSNGFPEKTFVLDLSNGFPEKTFFVLDLSTLRTSKVSLYSVDGKFVVYSENRLYVYDDKVYVSRSKNGLHYELQESDEYSVDEVFGLAELSGNSPPSDEELPFASLRNPPPVPMVRRAMPPWPK